MRVGHNPVDLARHYVSRNQGRRVELIAAYLNRAAAALDNGRLYAKWDVWNIAAQGWVVGSTPRDPLAPIRALRQDAALSMARAALRVARRGAGRCADPDCCVDDRAVPWLARTGRRLARDNRGDYCSVCAKRQPRYGRGDIEAERVMFDRAIAAVLGGDSRARRRRAA